MGAILAGLAFVLGLFAWCRFVPDEKARVRGVIVLWIAFPFLEVALFVANRHYHFY